MICFVTALGCEARPIVERFGMTPREGAFRWFRSESEDAALVVSGIGKLEAAAATAYLHARLGEPPFAVWLNTGVAGLGERPLGEVILAHTVTDGSSGRRWYPTRLGGPDLFAAEVVTVDAAESRFPLAAAYDMEAAGFYSVALGFSTSELVQVVKIVSDNREASWRRLDAAAIRGLVESGADPIERLARHLAGLRNEISGHGTPPPELAAYCERWRFTTSERRRLARLLSRWRALSPSGRLEPSAFEDVARARDLLERVEETVRRAAGEHPL